jgi:hypothetical protein
MPLFCAGAMVPAIVRRGSQGRASALGASLLFKGEDFAAADLQPALMG